MPTQTKIPRITYKDKIDHTVADIAEEHKISAADMNEIKNTFNQSAETIEQTLDETKEIQSELNDALAITGTYKYENGFLYLMRADGTYGQGIKLPRSDTIIKKDGALQNELNLNTARDTTSSKVFVQLKDTEGKAVMIETNFNNVYLTDNLGTEMTLKNYASLVSQCVSGCALFGVNFDVSLLTELEKFTVTE